MKQRVPDAAAGERLDRYLAGLAEIGSRTLAERLLAAGDVRVDGAVRQKSHRLAGGEEVEFEPPARDDAPLVAEEMQLRIAYDDEHLLVVDKPAGLVVHPAPGHATGTLVHGLLAHDAAGGHEERPGIVHRLDRDTSGLMVVARSEDAHSRLQSLVRRRELERRYLSGTFAELCRIELWVIVQPAHRIDDTRRGYLDPLFCFGYDDVGQR